MGVRPSSGAAGWYARRGLELPETVVRTGVAAAGTAALRAMNHLG